MQPSFADGYITKVCDPDQSVHYEKKALKLMQGGSFGGALYALRAAIDSLGTCPASMPPHRAYVIDVEMALAARQNGEDELAARNAGYAAGWSEQVHRRAYLRSLSIDDLKLVSWAD